VILIQILVVSVAGLMQSTQGTLGLEQPVARIGERTITRREIDCDLAFHDLRAGNATMNRDPKEICLEREQQRLDYLIADELFAAAAVKLRINVSSNDLAQDALANHYSEEEFKRLSERYCRLASATLLVYRGDPIADVYAHVIQTSVDGMTEKEFGNFVRMIGSAESAMRFIERHTPDHFRISITENARRRLARDKVIGLLRQESVKNGESYSMFASKFWHGLADELCMQILEPRYTALSMEGLAWQAR